MDKIKKGTAIRYSADKKVPEILAQARGILVQKLLDIAKKNNVTIYKDPDLAEVLSALKTGSEIPEDLYRAMAEVLMYCYNVNEKFREKLRIMEV